MSGDPASPYGTPYGDPVWRTEKEKNRIKHLKELETTERDKSLIAHVDCEYFMATQANGFHALSVRNRNESRANDCEISFEIRFGHCKRTVVASAFIYQY